MYTSADWPLMAPYSGVEDYDMQGELWKVMVGARVFCPYKGGNYNAACGTPIYDLQSGHATIDGQYLYKINLGPDAPHDPDRGSVKQSPVDYTLQTMISAAR